VGHDFYQTVTKMFAVHQQPMDVSAENRELLSRNFCVVVLQKLTLTLEDYEKLRQGRGTSGKFF